MEESASESGSVSLSRRLQQLHERYDDNIDAPSRTLEAALQRLRSVEREIGDPGSDVVARVQRLLDLVRRHAEESAATEETLQANPADAAIPSARQILGGEPTRTHQDPSVPLCPSEPRASSSAMGSSVSSPRAVRFSDVVDVRVSPRKEEDFSVTSKVRPINGDGGHAETAVVEAAVTVRSPESELATSTAAQRVRSQPAGVKWRVSVPGLLGDAAHFPSLASITFTLMGTLNVTADALTATIVRAAPSRVKPVILSDCDPIDDRVDAIFSDPRRFVCVVALTASSQETKESPTVLVGEYPLREFPIVERASEMRTALEAGFVELDLFLVERSALSRHEYRLTDVGVASSLRRVYDDI